MSYLKEVRKRAKANGYNPKALEFSDDNKHKLQIRADDGRVVRFGAKGYGDHIIWTVKEKRKQVPKGTANQKRDRFQKSHSKIKGDWKSDKFSPNRLALSVLW